MSGEPGCSSSSSRRLSRAIDASASTTLFASGRSRRRSAGVRSGVRTRSVKIRARASVCSRTRRGARRGGGGGADRAGEAPGGGVGGFACAAGRRQDVRERDALLDQRRGRLQQTSAHVDQVAAVGAEIAEFQGGGEV